MIEVRRSRPSIAANAECLAAVLGEDAEAIAYMSSSTTVCLQAHLVAKSMFSIRDLYAS